MTIDEIMKDRCGGCVYFKIFKDGESIEKICGTCTDINMAKMKVRVIGSCPRKVILK